MVNFRRGITKFRMWGDMGWHTARNRQVSGITPGRLYQPTADIYSTHVHTGWIGGGHDPSGHYLTHSYSPRTRWRQWPHLIEQGTEGDITHGMQTN